jgi:hypothetical protein
MNVNLPKVNQTGKNEWADVEDNDLALKAAIEELQAGIPGALGTWYTPKIIAAEEIRTNTAFGTLTTADEIKGVVLPENALIAVGYQAVWKNSVAEAGRAALFLNANQLAVASSSGALAQQATCIASTGVKAALSSYYGGLSSSKAGEYSGNVTTGQAVGINSVGAEQGGICFIFAAPGTYNIGVQYKATSGSVTVKERKLWVCVLG